MVTVEAAYAIASIVFTVILAVGAVSGMVTQIRCTDAAREVARLTAADDAGAREAGARIAGDDADISVDEGGRRVTVVVSSRALFLPGLTVSARAVAVPEPDGSDQVEFAPGVEP
ncbi:pilus assembly protein TadE [Gordonia pseudamarae]|uniref:Pilus assembly protein TadE n=1 Tax=Gordonia pseudamarae TaxID=2831662 RepID=A0ABX6IPP5_9ACTN|nr:MULTISPECIES: TadE family type IV pilus minor pilin [Gordonia]MBD0021894.1 pilus assembly protein TadE [Gordonia sp. (in: high G+C Gram-positive bacteria)]QHN28854.1 pilus assembly protein TadE [Gordonia pseudamarae]QHN37727.1 pilus assembly protein TadE [Gordonia pseudamarae]